jgi:NDP-sugar pyrophosphorylase family protein
VTAVFLLAAGLGTRLRPLTDWLPKPLLPVGDEPALAHILAQVRALEGPIVANVHHRAADLRAFLGGTGVLVSEEARILGERWEMPETAEAVSSRAAGWGTVPLRE